MVTHPVLCTSIPCPRPWLKLYVYFHLFNIIWCLWRHKFWTFLQTDCHLLNISSTLKVCKAATFSFHVIQGLETLNNSVFSYPGICWMAQFKMGTKLIIHWPFLVCELLWTCWTPVLEFLFKSSKVMTHGFRLQRVAVPVVPVDPVHLVLREVVVRLVV